MDSRWRLPGAYVFLGDDTVAISTTAGVIQFLDLAQSVRLVGTIVVGADGAWAAYQSEDGRVAVTGSRGAEQLIRWEVGGVLLPGESAWDRAFDATLGASLVSDLQ
jgi:hypothetical protein